MKIGELAKRTGLAASRIRFYEASGLIAAQRQANGYRDYSEQTVQTLGIITCSQQAGFTLEEVRLLLPEAGQQTPRPHDELLANLQRKVGEIEQMQERLARNKAQLLAIITSIGERPEGMGCAENAQRVLTQMQVRGIV